MKTQEVTEGQEKLTYEYVKLHRAMVRYFLALLQGDKPVKASQLDSARRFLKDNGVTLDKLDCDQDTQLASSEDLELPFQDEEKTSENDKAV